MTTVHVIVPEGVDDVTRPSGGNTYDARVIAGLTCLGWTVRRHVAPGDWPVPDAPARQALHTDLGALPDRSLVLIDGLVASVVPEVIVPESRRLRIIVLLHLPRGHDEAGGGVDALDAQARTRRDERAVLRAVRAIIVPSRWTREWLIAAYDLEPHRISVVSPGVDAAPVTAGGVDGNRLVCVGALTSIKGQDRLVDALADLLDLAWSCALVGSLAVEPTFAAHLRQRVAATGAGSRVAFHGALPAASLAEVYAAGDVLVVPSRIETYGLVVVEALARGLPVIGADVGGLAE
ncbi:glycosyltransferase family 4 protein, partial [Kribbia dieselivorans]|uniref:glycosyltransferase family 4 protein n=1 Tax=Kribbia dieselivorans TaxID=331526 RepID=UPI00083928F0